MMKKHDPENTSFEPILQDDSNRVYDKEEESYDTVLDTIVSQENTNENAESDYEGLTEHELDDKPPL